jgi:hypothetical protein
VTDKPKTNPPLWQESKLSEFQRAMHNAYPPGTRTRARLLILHREIVASGHRHWLKWLGIRDHVQNRDQVEQMNREFAAWGERMARYKSILKNPSSSDEQVHANVVRGLLFSPGKGTHIADALFPISWGRRVKILLKHEWESLLQFFKDAEQEAKDMLEAAADAGEFVADNIKPIIIGATATIVGGLILHAMIRRK